MSLHPVSERILSGQAPEPLLRAAARGAVPVPPVELIRLQVFLAAGGNAGLAQEAHSGLMERHGDEFLAVVGDAACEPQVLDWVSRHRRDDLELMAAVVGHARTPNRALLDLAGGAGGDLLDRMLDNQVRLLQSPELVAALDANPAMAGAARARLHDIHRELERRAGKEAARKAGTDDQAEPEAHAETEAGSPGRTTPEAGPEDACFEEEADDDGFDDDEDEGDLLVRIMNMTVPDKIALALKGGREERAILVRDPIKVVAMAVMKSPKLNEREVEAIAGMRNVVEDVIRAVCENREWMRSYAIINALCKNPKSPVRKVLTLMSRLNNRDLKMLGADRNISEVVRIAARRTYVARTAPATRGFKKG